MNITEDPTYQADIAKADAARVAALFDLSCQMRHSPNIPDRAKYIRDTDAIFAVYHAALFAAIDSAKLRLHGPGASPEEVYGLPPVAGNPALN